MLARTQPSTAFVTIPQSFEEVYHYPAQDFWSRIHILGNDLFLVEVRGEFKFVDAYSLKTTESNIDVRPKEIKDVVRSDKGSVAIRSFCISHLPTNENILNYTFNSNVESSGLRSSLAFPDICGSSSFPYDRYMYGVEYKEGRAISRLDFKTGQIEQALPLTALRGNDQLSTAREKSFKASLNSYTKLLFRISAKQLGIYLYAVLSADNHCEDAIQIYDTDNFSLQKEIYLLRRNGEWRQSKPFFAISRNGSFAVWQCALGAVEIFSKLMSAETSFEHPAVPVSVVSTSSWKAWSFDNGWFTLTADGLKHFSEQQLCAGQPSHRPRSLPLTEAAETVCKHASAFIVLPDGRMVIEKEQEGSSLANLPRQVFYNTGPSSGYFRFFQQRVAEQLEWFPRELSFIVAGYFYGYAAHWARAYFLHETIQDHLKLLSSPDFAKSDKVEEEKIVSKLFEMILDHSPQEIIKHIRNNFPRAEEKYGFVRYIFGMMQEAVSEPEVQSQKMFRAQKMFRVTR